MPDYNSDFREKVKGEAAPLGSDVVRECYGTSNSAKFVTGGFLCGIPNIESLDATKTALLVFSKIQLSPKSELHIATLIRKDIAKLQTRLSAMVAEPGEHFSKQNNNCALLLYSDGKIYLHNKAKVTFELTPEVLEPLGAGVEPDALYWEVYGSKVEENDDTIAQIRKLVGKEKFRKITGLAIPGNGGNETRNPTPTNIQTIVDNFNASCAAAGITTTKPFLHRYLAALFAKRFLILTGLAGSGKTKIAQAFARWITPDFLPADPFVPGTIFVSERVQYVIKKSDTVAVEFWNEETEGGTTKSMVPKEIIAEWADYIEQNHIGEDVSAQTICDAVEPTSRFTAYLHRFKPFLKLAAFALIKARRMQQTAKCYELVPVGADWTGNENVLGYPNGLDPKSYVTKPALDLILRARRFSNIPHFLILDEMNLSHVERYFADLLSMIESQEAITLYCDKKGADGKPENTRELDPILKLPDNLFIIGTVNVDETTYMFSPKVLDRANVIEFRVTEAEMAGFLDDPRKPDLDLLAGRGASFGPAFVVESGNRSVIVPVDVKDRFVAEMNLFFALQREHGGEYGFRVAHEASRFVCFYKMLGDGKIWDATAEAGKGAWVANVAGRDWFDAAFDALIIQKFLPKLHGSKVKLGPLLKKMNSASIEVHNVAPREEKNITAKLVDPSRVVPPDARYPVTAEKIFRMWRQLNENGFTSFPEN